MCFWKKITSLSIPTYIFNLWVLTLYAQQSSKTRHGHQRLIKLGSKDAISFMIQNFTFSFMTSMGSYVDPLHGP